MTWSWSADALTRLGGALSERNVCGPELTVRAVGDGHSNLTYLVSDGQRRVIVRRPPPPPIPAGAHDVVREARVVAALADTAVPVPPVFAVFAAGEMLEVPLVVTGYVDAVVITETTPAPLGTPAVRREIALSAVDTLAELHGVDWRACGLGDFGNPAGFNARHLGRICMLAADAHGELPSSFRSVADWLGRYTPQEAGAAIVHNDFRLGNLMMAHDSPGRVLAVLDWELATVGDPLFDLGYFLSSYPQPGEALTPTAKMATAVLEDGYPSRDDLLARYCERTGTRPANVSWYCALAQFKLAALYEYGRRRAESSGGDHYFADPGLVSSFLQAAEAMAG
jgi:aminoglycoside phosphotransferase (APT) family kinase protein